MSAYRYGSTPSQGPHQMLPTWTGFIHTTHDALVVLEACLNGQLHHVPRRPHDRERTRLITSGNVFIYEENASGIKRWTDGMTWSPSRIMGNFLVYRELNPSHHATGEKKIARKRKRSDNGLDCSNIPTAYYTAPVAEEDRRLVGSLVDSYGFKHDGLVKKTLTVQYQHIVHHIISYYNIKDIKEGKFKRPGFSQDLRDVVPRPDLLRGNFKAPIHEADDSSPGQMSSFQQSFRSEMPSMPPPLTPSYMMPPHSNTSMHYGPCSPCLPQSTMPLVHPNGYKTSLPYQHFFEAPPEYQLVGSKSASTVSTTPSPSPHLYHPPLSRRSSQVAYGDFPPYPSDSLRRTYSGPGGMPGTPSEDCHIRTKRARSHLPSIDTMKTEEANVVLYEPEVYDADAKPAIDSAHPDGLVHFTPTHPDPSLTHYGAIPFTTAGDLRHREGIFYQSPDVTSPTLHYPMHTTVTHGGSPMALHEYHGQMHVGSHSHGFGNHMSGLGMYNEHTMFPVMAAGSY